MSPPRCIIVDDLRASRTLLQAWIGECGYECIVCGNAEDAWVSICLSAPKMIITDIEMPGVSGLELLYALRRHPSDELKAIPTIVISSLEDGDIQKFVLDAGGTYFLPKPLSKESVQRLAISLSESPANQHQVQTPRTDAGQNASRKVSPTLRRLYRDLMMRGPKLE